MAYKLIEVSATSRKVRRTFATKEEGVAHAEEIAAFMLEDRDYPGHFDIFTKAGEVLTLEPSASVVNPASAEASRVA